MTIEQGLEEVVREVIALNKRHEEEMARLKAFGRAIDGAIEREKEAETD